MRAFIAIDLPAEIKQALSKLQDGLKLSGADVKWVEPKNIHLTLKFLGEITEESTAKIHGIIAAAAAVNPLFQARIAALGAFPSAGSPRVIWAGIDQGGEEAKKIAGQLEEKIAKLGIPREKRAFSSHITLGRTRSSKDKESLRQGLEKAAAELAGKNLIFCVREITLYKSSLTPAGPIYTALSRENLAIS
ncbi:MAG: 2'-5' RNA ligase [Omnitrophica WOR_2 bacterium RIFCSPLOWO2_12_FULL_51_8]|nr:MAG: 2'-5' RNA ligase [Omnitrophica WOR_2 bacterium RIFCSPLOWO2_12_FULL_51_8]